MKNKLISIILIILAIIGIGITTFAFVSPGYQYQLKMNEYSNNIKIIIAVLIVLIILMIVTNIIFKKKNVKKGKLYYSIFVVEIIAIIICSALGASNLVGYMEQKNIYDNTMEKYYDENIYGEITVRHILITPEVEDDMTDDEKTEAKNKALEEAKSLLEQIKNSDNKEEKITELAKEKSDDTGTASEGGLLVNITNESGLVEEFWEASLNLGVGELTAEPVETEFGYHIIYKVSQNEKPALDTVRDRVLDNLTSEMLSDTNASQVYWAGLREKYNMVIYDDVIKEAYDSTMKNLNKETE